MIGLLGKKLGMTSIFNEDGRNIPCTVIEAGPCTVVQVKTEDLDSYNAVQLGFGEKKEKHTTKPMMGHFRKAGVAPQKFIREFRDFDNDVNPGDTVDLSVLSEGDLVSVTGTSKGKGFQGVVKRHGFRGVGMRTHGQHNRERAPGSIGAASYPAKVFKGMKMGGQTGNKRSIVIDLEVVKIIPEENLLLLKGAVPGHKGSYVIIEKE